MPLTSTVLFGRPHTAIASLIRARINASISTKIVVGFATPGGLAELNSAIRAAPTKLKTLVIGAATYKAFEAVEQLITAGVPETHLWIYLGHTKRTDGRTHPYARYHPMLHSKIYYMELPDGQACAFIGSHNLTSFALGGLNAEASTMIEGPLSAPEFDNVRSHINALVRMATQYSSNLKEAYAWWTKQYIDALASDIRAPTGWTSERTILVFCEAPKGKTITSGQAIYFELPQGIRMQQLHTPVHFFLFDALPKHPRDAFAQRHLAQRRFTAHTSGGDDKQGNAEVIAQWHIEHNPLPLLKPVPSGTHRPSTALDKQQVRAIVDDANLGSYEYAFALEQTGWEPEFDPDADIEPVDLDTDLSKSEASLGTRSRSPWKLVSGLRPRSGAKMEMDESALRLARPDAGAFIVVALRSRPLPPADAS